MGFRKSINFGGFRINLSKTGIGYSFRNVILSIFCVGRLNHNCCASGRISGLIQLIRPA